MTDWLSEKVAQVEGAWAAFWTLVVTFCVFLANEARKFFVRVLTDRQKLEETTRALEEASKQREATNDHLDKLEDQFNELSRETSEIRGLIEGLIARIAKT